MSQGQLCGALANPATKALDEGGRDAHSFSIIHDLEQIIKQPTHVPDRHDQAADALALFLTANPSVLYSYCLFPPGLLTTVLYSSFSSHPYSYR